MTDNLTVYKMAYLKRVWHIGIDKRLKEVAFYRRHFNTEIECKVSKRLPPNYIKQAIQVILWNCKHLVDEAIGLIITIIKGGFPVYE